jgi:hypothetical protein
VAEQAYAYVTLIPVAKGFQQAIAKEMGGVAKVGETAGTETGKGLSKGFGKAVAGIAALVAGAFSVKALVDFTKESVLAAEAVSTANARLSAVATATGVFGNETDKVTQRLQDFAKAQELRIAVDDTVIKGVQAQLLSFKQLSGSADEVGGAFDRATIAAFDMAAAGFGSAEGNATALGKALEDPIKGVAALARNGTTFTDQQKEQIKVLQESGDLLGAQEIILAEVEGQYGGVAEATADASVRLGIAFHNIKEAVGDELLPIFADLVEGMLPVIDEVIPVFRDAIQALAPVLTDLVGQFPALMEALFPVIPIIGNLAGIFLDIAAQILPIIVDLFNQLLPAIAELLPTIGKFIAEALEVLVPILVDLIEALLPIVQALLPVFMDLFEALAPVVINLISAMLPMIVRILPIFIQFIEFLTPILVWLAELLGTVLVIAVNILVTVFEKAQGFFDGFGKFFAALWYGIQFVFVSVINGLITGFENFVNFFIDGFNLLIKGINVVRKVLDLKPLELVARVTLGRLDLPDMPALAEGGFVNGPTTALIGEAGPEVVMPLDRFEQMMGLDGSGGRSINYYAAPNKSFDAEQELQLAMKRVRIMA